MGDRLHVGLLALTDLVRRLGNPLRTEAAAFRWLVAIVVLVAVLWVLLVLVRALV